MSSETEQSLEDSAPTANGWRYKLGMAMFVLPVLSMVMTPIVIPLFGLSGADSAALIGIPLLGKEGFKRVKNQLFSKLKLTEKPISKQRHNWGLSFVGGSLFFQGCVLIWIVFGFFYLGKDHLTESVGGATFAEEASFVAYSLIFSAFAFFFGVWLLGGRFVSRLNAALTWQDEE